MKTNLRLLPLLLSFALTFGCSHTGLQSTLPTIKAATAARVLLISFDGVAADEVERRRLAGELPSLSHLIDTGTSARRMIPVNPTLTASTHISIATGADPQQTGVLSNTFHLEGTPVEQSLRGFETDIEVETLWETAQAAGKTVGCITFPGLDGKTARRRADWGLIYTQPVSRSRVAELTAADLEPAPATEFESFSVPRRARIPIELKADGIELQETLEIIFIDRTDDGMINYDTARPVWRGQTVSVEKGWFAISAHATSGAKQLYGSWWKLLDVPPDLSKVRIYAGSFSRNEGYPESYRAMIDAKVGFWPGPPDEPRGRDWLKDRTRGIDVDTFSEQLERMSQFMTRVTTLSMKEMKWDLLFAYQPIVDHAEHQYRIVNSSQSLFNDANSAVSAVARFRAYQAFDRATGELYQALDPATDALIVTGDHGLAPIDTSFKINRLLIDLGLATVENGKPASSTRWFAYRAGSSAHIYPFSGADSEVEGERIIEALKALRLEDGRPVVELVRRREKGAHRNSGELIVHTFPYVDISPATDAGLFAKTDSFGQHGALNHHPELHTIFVAAGKNVPRRRVEAVPQTAIARFAASLMRVPPPAAAQ